MISFEKNFYDPDFLYPLKSYNWMDDDFSEEKKDFIIRNELDDFDYSTPQILPFEDLIKNEFKKTDCTATTFLNKKRNRNKKENLNLDENGKKNNSLIQNNKAPKSKGRKKKDNNYKEDALHNKFKEDNIMRKIKTFIFKYILELLNNSLIDKSYQFCRLKKDMNVDINKQFNIDLLERKLYDIYKNTDSNKKNKKNINSILIDKIYEEKKETETIKILDLTYNEILNRIKTKDLNYFLSKIYEKEESNQNKYINKYIASVENLLDKYETWFQNKQKRRAKNKKLN